MQGWPARIASQPPAEEGTIVRIAALLIFTILAMLAASASTHARLDSPSTANEIAGVSSR